MMLLVYGWTFIVSFEEELSILIMAEYVFQNVEGMLPELEEMERLELFTKDEIKYVEIWIKPNCSIQNNNVIHRGSFQLILS